MSKLIELEYDSSKILVESEDVEIRGGLAPAGAVEETEKNLGKLLDTIKPFCKSLRNTMETLGDDKPETYSIEFGLSFGGEGNIFVARISAQASLKITVNWNQK